MPLAGCPPQWKCFLTPFYCIATNATVTIEEPALPRSLDDVDDIGPERYHIPVVHSYTYVFFDY